MKKNNNSDFIYLWWSTNINVQINNSYKINLKVIKYMLIKAITLFRLRAVSDFLFAFSSLININEAPVCH